MKVVINVCYGGFGLSVKAERMYWERKGVTPYFYEMMYINHRIAGFLRVDDDKAVGVTSTLSRDLGKEISHMPEGEDLFLAQDYELPRDDPDLVAVVEELGEAANGPCAKLKIVEIPDGVDYGIGEYDGNEHIYENHRTWS